MKRLYLIWFVLLFRREFPKLVCVWYFSLSDAGFYCVPFFYLFWQDTALLHVSQALILCLHFPRECKVSLPLNQSLSFRVWFPPLWTALTMQMCRRQSVRNLGAGINISRRQKIWWVSKMERHKVWHSHFCLFMHTHICTHTSCHYSMFSSQASLCLPTIAWQKNAFLSCCLIIIIHISLQMIYLLLLLLTP